MIKTYSLPTLLALGVILGHLPAKGQTATQYRIDTISSEHNILKRGVVTPDGDHWAVLNTTDGTALWKADGAGTPLWSLILDSSDAGAALTPLPDSGCALLTKGQCEYFNVDYCCPVKSRTKSTGSEGRLFSRKAVPSGRLAGWAFSQRA